MGRRKSKRMLTPLELEIMNVLWDCGPSNVQAVQAKLSQSPKLAYTTVQTMLNVLYRKGRVRRTLRGRAYEYEPLLTRERAVRRALREVIDRLFGGSAEGLVMSLVESRQLDPGKLKKLSALVEERERNEKEEGDEGD